MTASYLGAFNFLLIWGVKGRKEKGRVGRNTIGGALGALNLVLLGRQGKEWPLVDCKCTGQVKF